MEGKKKCFCLPLSCQFSRNLLDTIFGNLRFKQILVFTPKLRAGQGGKHAQAPREVMLRV